jgi:hypothetical protein
VRGRSEESGYLKGQMAFELISEVMVGRDGEIDLGVHLEEILRCLIFTRRRSHQ